MSASASSGEGNETFFIRVWKPLPSRRILKTLRGNPKESLKRTISASGGLGLGPKDATIIVEREMPWPLHQESRILKRSFLTNLRNNVGCH